MAAVVAALPEEGEAVLERLVDATPVEMAGPAERAPPVLVRGVLGGAPVAVAVTGDGEHNARQGIASVFRALPVGHLVVVGVAGGLVPGLEPCSMVLGREVWMDAERRLRPSDGLTRMAGNVADARPGVVMTVRELLDTPAAKASAVERLPAPDDGGGVVVADMETAFYAAEAETRGVPWVVLRAVSDTADESLPSFLEDCRDEGGSVRRSVVARHVFSRPSVVPDLLRLRRRVRCCADELARSAERLAGAVADRRAVDVAPGGRPGRDIDPRRGRGA